MSTNSMFYQTHVKEGENELPTWNQVILLKGYNRGIVNKIKFDYSGRIIVTFDMQGTSIVGLALTWEPFFSIKDCRDLETICKERSYLADTMNILGAMANFTWEVHRQKDDDWGISPISGPANASGIWGGMVGDVYYGKYQLSIR